MPLRCALDAVWLEFRLCCLPGDLEYLLRKGLYCVKSIKGPAYVLRKARSASLSTALQVAWEAMFGFGVRQPYSIKAADRGPKIFAAPMGSPI